MHDGELKRRYTLDRAGMFVTDVMFVTDLIRKPYYNKPYS